MDDIRATNVNIFSGIHKKGFVNKQEKGFVINKKKHLNILDLSWIKDERGK